MAPNPIVVDGPEAPAHNLLASVTPKNPDDGHWENGITFTQRGCYVINGTCIVCEDDPDDSFDDQDCSPPAVFLPYELDLGTSWMPMDNFDIDAAVEADFKVGTSSRLEQLAWSGCAGGTNPEFSGATALPGTPGPKGALGSMMAALISADDHIGARGTIYMSPRISVMLTDLLREDDGKLYTLHGRHKVVLGNFPATHIAGHIGEPIVYLGDVRFTEAADDIRRNNTRPFRVQRSALVAWNTCAAFLQAVDLNEGIDGGGA